MQQADQGPSTSARYPTRAGSRGKVYREPPALDDDDFLFCDDCGRESEGDCPKHGPLHTIEDAEVPDAHPERALKSVPSCLAVLDSKIPGAGLGVWTRKAIPRRVRFGPYVGDITKKMQTGYGWGIRREGKTVHCVDALNVATSNWMRYVNCARNAGEENLHPYQYKGQLYYRTVCAILPNTELLVWYGDSYGRDLGIDPKAYREPAKDARAFTGTFPCERQCGVCFVSPLLLAQHRRSGHCHAEIKRRRACGAPGAPGGAGASTSATAARGDQRPTEGASVNLQSQMRVQSGERHHSCATCGAAFARRGNLQTHTRTHSGEKPYSCSTCGAAFSRSSALQRHMRTHSGEKPYSCTTCGAAFRESSHLQAHMRIHSGEKPYSCATCGAAFTQSGDLQTHMRIHSGEKPYSCATCGAAFARSSDLQRHTRTHSGEKPYSCATCGAAFTKSCNLQQHVRTQHGEKP